MHAEGQRTIPVGIAEGVLHLHAISVLAGTCGQPLPEKVLPDCLAEQTLQKLLFQFQLLRIRKSLIKTAAADTDRGTETLPPLAGPGGQGLQYAPLGISLSRLGHAVQNFSARNGMLNQDLTVLPQNITAVRKTVFRNDAARFLSLFHTRLSSLFKKEDASLRRALFSIQSL